MMMMMMMMMMHAYALSIMFRDTSNVCALHCCVVFSNPGFRLPRLRLVVSLLQGVSVRSNLNYVTTLLYQIILTSLLIFVALLPPAGAWGGVVVKVLRY